MNDGTGTTTYQYDNLNRPTQIVNPKSEIVNYQYDARGNRTQLTYPDGKTITYAYDRLDRLTNLNPSWDSGSYRYSYNSQLQLESLIRPNGLQTVYGYDSANRLTGLTHRSTGWTMEYGYTLNEIGNITRAEETFTSFQSTYLPIIFKNGLPALLPPLAPITPTTRIIDYTYDNLSRLTAADYSTGGFFHYSYDPRGNRLTQSTISGTTNYTYDAANRLTQVDGQSYTWDDNGNLLNDGQRTYSYDSANRLISVTKGITTTNFVYNGDGDRVAQTVGGVTTDYTLDPIGLAQVLVATTGGQSEFYVPGLAQYTNSSWQYFASDRLGSVRQMVDPTGQLLLAQSFDPFGNMLEQGGAGQSIFGYTGEQRDPTGLVYLRARYYQPSVGRFLSADTIVPEPLRSVGWNRYAYTGNNPVRYTDPSGHCFLVGVDTLACIDIAAFAVGLYLTYEIVTSDAYQDALEGIIESIPSVPLPPFQLPGTTLQDTPKSPITPDIKPCSDPNQGLETFPAPQGQTIDDILLADPIGPGIELPNVLEATLDDILRDTIPGPGTKGRSVNRLKYGGFEDALRDFNSLDDLSIIGSYPGGVIVGELPGGIKVNVRPGSLFGNPTLEIQRGKRKIKIRYVEE